VDFAVMVRQAHHARRCTLSLSKGQSNDIMMTSGDACPTNKGSLKVAAKGSLI